MAPGEPNGTSRLSSVVLRNIAAIGAARAGSILLDGVAYVLVARYLGPELYGAYVAVLAFVILLDLACDLSILDITVREMSRDMDRLGTWLSGAMMLRAALSLIGLGAFAVYLYASWASLSLEAKEAAWIAALILPVGALRVPLAVFRAGMRMELELAVTVLARAINLACILSVIHLGGSLAMLFGVVLLTRTLLGGFSLVLAGRVFRPALRLDLSVVRRLARESVPMGISGLFVAVQLKADILLVAAISGAAAGGLYGVVAQLPEYFLYFPVVVTTPVLPVLSRFFAESNHERFQTMFQKLFDVLIAVILPVAVLVSLVPETAVTLLFGSAYVESAAVVPLLMASIVFMWLSHAAAIATVAAGLQRHFIWIQTICVVVYLLLNLLLIPRWSFEGAAVARLIGTIIAPVLTLLVLKHGAGIRLSTSVAARILLACGLMAIAVSLLGAHHLAAACVLGLAVYVAALWLTGAAPWTIPRQLEGQI